MEDNNFILQPTTRRSSALGYKPSHLLFLKVFLKERKKKLQFKIAAFIMQLVWSHTLLLLQNRCHFKFAKLEVKAEKKFRKWSAKRRTN
mgnify:FL=1